VLHFTGPQAWSAAAAVGLAVPAMDVTGTFHPSAGINPLLVVSNNLPWTFLLAPVLAGALLLPPSPMSGTDGSGSGRGRCAGCEAAAPAVYPAPTSETRL
jgi:hypothetical protein